MEKKAQNQRKYSNFTFQRDSSFSQTYNSCVRLEYRNQLKDSVYYLFLYKFITSWKQIFHYFLDPILTDLQNLIFRFIIYFCYKEEMSNPPIYNSKFSPGQSFSPTRASFLPSQISPSYNPTIRSSSPFNPKMQATSVIENDLQDIQKSFEDETQEVQKRYNFIYERYLRLAKTVQELENALDEEKRKNSSLQDSMNAMARDFDNERKVRANLERELAPLRDELKRKDLTIAELEKQLGKFQQNNALLATENNALRAELAKVGQFYQGKLKELEDNYLGQLRDLKGRCDLANTQLEQVKIDSANQLKQLDNDWRDKCRNMENQIRNMDAHLNELEHQCRALADENGRMKTNYEDQLAKTVQAIRQDEENKWKALVDDLKAQMAKTLNDERLYWESRLHDLENELNVRNKQLVDLKNHRDQELANALNESQNLRTQLTNLALENDRLRKELQAKDQATAWLDRENQALKTDAKVKDNHIQELANALQAHEKEKVDWENHIRNLEQQLRDRDERLKGLEEQLLKFRLVFGSLKDQLVGNIAKAVDSTLTSSEVHKNR